MTLIKRAPWAWSIPRRCASRWRKRRLADSISCGCLTAKFDAKVAVAADNFGAGTGQNGSGDSVDLIVGADLAAQIDAWRDSDALRTLVRVGVVPRPGGAMVLPEGWDSYEIEMDPVDLSSTFIRKIPYGPENLRDFVPESVIPLYESFQD